MAHSDFPKRLKIYVDVNEAWEKFSEKLEKYPELINEIESCRSCLEQVLIDGKEFENSDEIAKFYLMELFGVTNSRANRKILEPLSLEVLNTNLLEKIEQTAAQNPQDSDLKILLARCSQKLPVENEEQSQLRIQTILDNYNSALELGNKDALKGMGDCYANWGNKELAFQKYQEALEMGDTSVEVRIAEIWEAYGALPKAFEHYSNAAQNGDSQAQLKMGICYYNGVADVVEQNSQRAIEFFTQSAEQGNVTAQLALGQIFCSEAITSSDLTLSGMYLHLAADQGSAEACYYLGRMYGMGLVKAPVLEGEDPIAGFVNSLNCSFKEVLSEHYPYMKNAIESGKETVRLKGWGEVGGFLLDEKDLAEAELKENKTSSNAGHYHTNGAGFTLNKEESERYFALAEKFGYLTHRMKAQDEFNNNNLSAAALNCSRAIKEGEIENFPEKFTTVNGGSKDQAQLSKAEIKEVIKAYKKIGDSQNQLVSSLVKNSCDTLELQDIIELNAEYRRLFPNNISAEYMGDFNSAFTKKISHIMQSEISGAFFNGTNGDLTLMASSFNEKEIDRLQKTGFECKKDPNDPYRMVMKTVKKAPPIPAAFNGTATTLVENDKVKVL